VRGGLDIKRENVRWICNLDLLLHGFGSSVRADRIEMCPSNCLEVKKSSRAIVVIGPLNPEGLTAATSWYFGFGRSLQRVGELF
jgi:hypothetical protein